MFQNLCDLPSLKVNVRMVALRAGESGSRPRGMILTPPGEGVHASLERLDDAAQHLALPVVLVDGPALYGPAAGADDVRQAAAADLPLALQLGRLQLLFHPEGVAA